MVADTEIAHMSQVNKMRTDRLANALMKNGDLGRSQSMRYRRHGTAPIERPAPVRVNKSPLAISPLVTSPMKNSLDDNVDESEFRRRALTLPNKGRPSPRQPVKQDTLDNEEVVIERMRMFTLDPDHAAVINRGDSFRCRSNTGGFNGSMKSINRRSLNGSSKNSSNLSSRSHSPHAQVMIDSVASPVELLSPTLVEDGVKRYHIIVLGSAGVGKTSMINQFMTSEYCNPFQDESGECPDENTVNVLLDGEESQMTFIEVNNKKSDMWLSLSGAGYIVAYSVSDMATFRNAQQALYELRQSTHAANKPIILVANKIDLERKRVVSVDEGKQTAKENNCKFVEIAVVLGHHMDELLVGVLAQVRMDESNGLVVSGTGSRSELITAFDAAFPTILQSNRRSSSGSSTASNGKLKKKIHPRHNHLLLSEKWSSLRRLDDAVASGCSQLSHVGGRFVQKLFGRRRRSHSLEDLLAFQRR